MVNTFTKRNHYNPCFWTACWNTEYFRALVAGTQSKFQSRDQELFVLNIHSDSIYSTKVSNVHYDKNLGKAEITPDSIKRFFKRWYPANYSSICEYVEENPEPLFMDFEEILDGIEQKGKYDTLIEAVRLGGVSSVEHKGFLTCILIIHAMRSHEMMVSMIDVIGSLGLEKWEYFWLLKNAWSNPLILAHAAIPLSMSQWIFYRTSEHYFPLCDSPVMIGKNTLMAVLSPRLVLEINLNVSVTEDFWIVHDSISSSKYREFRKRSISNTFKEIIFHDKEELQKWQKLPEYKRRSAVLRNPIKSRELLAEAANRVIWAMQGFGRSSDKFEKWAKSCRKA